MARKQQNKEESAMETPAQKEIVCVHCGSKNMKKITPEKTIVVLGGKSKILYECLDCKERQYS